MKRACLLLDPALAPRRAVLSRLLGAPVVTRPLPLLRPAALVTGFALEAYRSARDRALAQGIPLILAGEGLFSGAVDAAFVDPPSMLLMEISPDVLRRSASPGRALRLALLERAAQAAGAGAGRRLRQRLALKLAPELQAELQHPEGRRPALSPLLAALPTGEAGPAADEGPDSATGAAVISPDALLDTLIVDGLRFPDPYRPSGMLPAAAALRALEVAADHAAENAQPSFSAGAQSWNRASINAIFGTPRRPVTFCATVEEAIDRAAAAGGRVLSWAGRTSPAMESFATARGVPLLRIEDGFIRSVGLGAGMMRGASLAFDDEGIYYDATRPSRMERLLATAQLGEEERERAAALRRLIVSARITKYNVGGALRALPLPTDREVLLVPGQVADDAGVRRSVSAVIDSASCDNVNLELLRAVRARNPDAFVVFKPHPDVQKRLRKGRVEHRDLAGLADAVVTDAGILELIDRCDRVETFSSLSGFEALIRGKPVTVYGMPFYAGWGLTRDLTLCPRRRRQLDLDTLVYVALVRYARTIDPVTLKPCTPEVLIERLGRIRASRWHRVRAWALREASWLGRRLGI